MTDAPKTGGKGRPTPKRAEAQRRRRGPVARPPVDRKEAARQRRAELAARRTAMRRALLEGDESRYPRVHAGPERRLVRDVVDARRGFAWLILPGWVAMFALSFVPAEPARAAGSAGLSLLLGLIVADTWLARHEIRRTLAARFPDGTRESRRRLVGYGLLRNAAMRRFRTPPPRVERGGTL